MSLVAQALSAQYISLLGIRGGRRLLVIQQQIATAMTEALGQTMKNDSVDVLIATGCPNSGWEGVLPALQQSGIHLLGEAFEQWHDRVCRPEGPSGSSAMPLPGSAETEEAARLFEQGPAGTVLGADARSLQLLDFWAEHIPTARFLLFYTPVETALANALRHGHEPQGALQDWLTANRQLIRFQRHHRSQAVLLDAEAASRNPAALAEVGQRLGIALDPAQPPAPSVAGFQLERLLVRQILVGEVAASDLQTELEACALPLGGSSAESNLDGTTLIAEYRQQQQEQAELQAAFDQAEVQAEQLQQENQDLKRSSEETAQENELLLLQLHQVQEELEHYFLKYQELASSGEGTSPVSAENAAQPQPDQAQTPTEAPAAAKASRRLSRKDKRRLQREIKLLQESRLFDAAWYLAQHPDVAQAGVDPVMHFLRFGAEEGRNPSPSFDVTFYREAYPDVEASGINPLVHFLQFGRDEGRVPTRWGSAT